MTVLLASGSPRRRDLLGLLGRPFEVRVPDVDESVYVGEEAATYVERVARTKALAVVRGDDDLVIAADTAVVLDGRIFGKPIDSADARTMLATLSGRSHEVMTAVAVAHGDHLVSAVDVSTVRFTVLTNREIEWYVATGEPLDKAGAYAVQGVGGLFVAAVDGNVQSVIGLPLALVRTLARGVGVDLLPT